MSSENLFDTVLLWRVVYFVIFSLQIILFNVKNTLIHFPTSRENKQNQAYIKVKCDIMQYHIVELFHDIKKSEQS